MSKQNVPDEFVDRAIEFHDALVSFVASAMRDPRFEDMIRTDETVRRNFDALHIAAEKFVAIDPTAVRVNV